VEWPLIVVHSAVVFNQGFAKAILKSLYFNQTKDFQRRVVIGGIESQLDANEASAMVGVCLDGLSNPATQKSFRLLSLPYPTSASTVLPEVVDHKRNIRPILVLFDGSLAKGKGHHGNPVRIEMVHRMQIEHGAVCSPHFTKKGECAVCVEGEEKECKGLINHEDLPGRVWTLAAKAVFCMEPPGDTPTRSHFYVAVAMGCIPIVFDGGVPGYSMSEPTYWAWRRPGNLEESDGSYRKILDAVALDYSQFTIAVDLSDSSGSQVKDSPILDEDQEDLRRNRSHSRNYDPRVRVEGTSLNVPLFEYLKNVQSHGRSRFEDLQKGLGGAAAAMIYAPERSFVVPREDDAFSRFIKLVTLLSESS